MICTPKVRQTFGVHITIAWFFFISKKARKKNLLAYIHKLLNFFQITVSMLYPVKLFDCFETSTVTPALLPCTPKVTPLTVAELYV